MTRLISRERRADVATFCNVSVASQGGCCNARDVEPQDVERRVNYFSAYPLRLVNNATLVTRYARFDSKYGWMDSTSFRSRYAVLLRSQLTCSRVVSRVVSWSHPLLAAARFRHFTQLSQLFRKSQGRRDGWEIRGSPSDRRAAWGRQAGRQAGRHRWALLAPSWFNFRIDVVVVSTCYRLSSIESSLSPRSIHRSPQEPTNDRGSNLAEAKSNRGCAPVSVQRTRTIVSHRRGGINGLAFTKISLSLFW